MLGVKGDKVVLRRWFSWIPVCERHDRTWHSKLLVLIYVGIKAGIYRSWEEAPLWGSVGLKQPAEEPGAAAE
eukprot:4716786-Lingulodinium_polyedra.AAC.1